ncbi:MAG: adaptor protein MecA [Clostridiales bacterium]|nr:adaptor protein MecA [Clostridiales bacterium]
MKIERINENQIRCTLNSADLSTRNLNLGELAYGSEKARNLFHEMIQKASSEVGFEAEDIPLMVEAIPISNESVILLITKIEDPEELDTRFSRFSPLSDEDAESLWNPLPAELLEGADNLFQLLKNDLLGMPAPSPETADSTSVNPENTQTTPPTEPVIRIFRFNNLDQVITAAAAVGDICDCSNSLYKNPSSGQYYLTVSNADTDALCFSRLCNTLMEFSEKIHQETGSEAYYQEHYDTMISGQALQKLMTV